MKTHFLKFTSVILSLLMFSSQIKAENLTRFFTENSEIDCIVNFDEAEIYDVFFGITEDFETNTTISSSVMLPVFPDQSEHPETAFGMPSFLWGCIGTIPGIILVMIVTDDYGEAKKAFSGCVTTYVSIAAFYVIYAYLLTTTTAATTL